MAKSWWKRLFKERQPEAPTGSEEARDLSQETRRGEQPELDESYEAARWDADRREMDRAEAWLAARAQERAEAARQEAQRLLGPWLEAIHRRSCD